MSQLTTNKIFLQINELYSKYHELTLKRSEVEFNQKYDSAYKAIREKIIIAICKIYFKFWEKDNPTYTLSDINTRNLYEDNYSDIIVEEITKSLDSYENSISKKNGYNFSSYTCLNIKNAVGKARSKSYISVNHGGITVSDYEASMVRKVLKADKELQKLGFTNDDHRNRKLTKLLNIGIETVQKYKYLSKYQTRSIQKNNKDSTFSILDLETNLCEEIYQNPESAFFLKEIKLQIPVLLNVMETIYTKKRDKKISELLAIMVLDNFSVLKKNHIQNGFKMDDFYPSLYKLFSKYTCFDSNIVRNFFLNPNYILPTQKDIADKYGIEKSAATKILIRFRNKLKENENVKNYFSDFI